jgi:signal peptide peptidase SppA
VNKNRVKNKNNNAITEKTPLLVNRNLGKMDKLLSLFPFSFGIGKPTIAVMRLDEVIGKTGIIKSGLTISSLNKLIEKMFKIEQLKAVCLCINSPGGSPVQAELIATRIIKLAEEKEVPVYSFVEDVAASGGYWLAMAGDKIFVNRSSIIGSIGVISSRFGFHEAMAKIGVERRLYTQGKTKSILDPFQPQKQSDIKIITKIQKEVHEHFIDSVKKRRGGKITQSDDILFNGEFWSGQIAVDYGMADGINDLYSFIGNKFGNQVNIEYIEHKESWFKKKLGINTLSREFTDNLAGSAADIVENKIKNSKFHLE